MIERLDKHKILLNRIAEAVENQNVKAGRIESNVEPLVKSMHNLSNIVIHALDHGKEIQEIKDGLLQLENN